MITADQVEQLLIALDTLAGAVNDKGDPILLDLEEARFALVRALNRLEATEDRDEEAK